jgi:hypothetical protein
LPFSSLVVCLLFDQALLYALLPRMVIPPFPVMLPVVDPVVFFSMMDSMIQG